jgi:acyl-CoA thioester hydrolase
VTAHGHLETIQIHFDDLDPMGIVHNSRYAILLERSLTDFWVARGWAADAASSEFEDVFMAVREFTVTYRAPIFGLVRVNVRFWIEHLGNSSAVYAFRIESADGATLHAEGRRAVVNLDPATFRPTRISDGLRAAAAPLMAPALATA